MMNNENMEPKLPQKTLKKPKPPVIRQTLTSLFRLAKVNPLLLLNKESKDNLGLNNIDIALAEPQLEKAKFNSLINLPALKKSLNRNKSQDNFVRNGVASSVREIKQRKPDVLKRTVSVKQPSKPEMNQFVRPKVPPPTKAQKVSVTKNPTTSKPVRRSLSAEYFDKKKQLAKIETEQAALQKETTQSMENIKQAMEKTNEVKNHVRFKDLQVPHQSRRQTAFSTPTNFQRNSIPFTSTPRPQPNQLQERLSEWLQRRGKPHGSYHHLKCFGLTPKTTVEEEEKENVERPADIIRNSSYEDLKIETEDNSSINLQSVARDALGDLNSLILEGYPREQCEAWLGRIREKYRFVEEEPQYWECRAAIEQNRGNITTAVECLRTAIVKGAEVHTVDQSLENLLKKFSLLHLSPKCSPQESNEGRERGKILLDARNAFKSSIIRFAVQERALKKNQKEKYTITPVRRSTRQSRSGYIRTPGTELTESIKDIQDYPKEDLFQFRNNKYLSIRYN